VTIGDLRTDGAQHRLGAAEGGLVAANHERGAALRQRDRAAGDRCVEHDASAPRELRRHRPAHVRGDGAHVGVDAARGEPGDDSVLAERYLAHGLPVGDDGEHDLGTGGGGARAFREPHAGIDQRPPFRRVAIPAGHRVTGGDQAGHDALAHGPEPDESDVHGAAGSRLGASIIIVMGSIMAWRSWRGNRAAGR
jgi:hypothetical protein